MALTLFGIYGLAEFPYDDALNLSRSLQIRLSSQSGGYRQEGRMIGISQKVRETGRSGSQNGYFAPLIRNGSKLRLALPDERHPKRMEGPQTEWDFLHGLILSYREGDTPVARAYLDRNSDGRESVVLDLLTVWMTEIADEQLRKEARAIDFGLRGS